MPETIHFVPDEEQAPPVIPLEQAAPGEVPPVIHFQPDPSTVGADLPEKQLLDERDALTAITAHGFATPDQRQRLDELNTEWNTRIARQTPVQKIKTLSRLTATRAIPKGAGAAIGGIGKLMTAGIGQIAGTGDTLADVDLAVQLGRPMPVEEAAAQVSGAAGIAARAGLGMVETVPKLAAMALFPQSLLAQSIAAGGIFGLTPQGKFDVKSGIIGAMLPGVAGTAKLLAGKALAKAALSGSRVAANDTAQFVVEELANQAALNAVMIGADSPELLKLAREDPKQAMARLEEMIGGNLAWSLFGAASHYGLKHPTTTKRIMDATQMRKYANLLAKPYIQNAYNRLVAISRGENPDLQGEIERAKQRQAEGGGPQVAPPATTQTIAAPPIIPKAPTEAPPVIPPPLPVEAPPVIRTFVPPVQQPATPPAPAPAMPPPLPTTPIGEQNASLRVRNLSRRAGTELPRVTPGENVPPHPPEVRQEESPRPDGGDRTQQGAGVPQPQPQAPVVRRPASDFEPALLVNGQPVTGGADHSEIMRKAMAGATDPIAVVSAFNDESGHIFVDKQGNRYTRMQAAAALGESQPLQSERLNQLKAEERRSKVVAPAELAELPATMAEVRRRITSREELQATMDEVRNRITQRESGQPPPRPDLPRGLPPEQRAQAFRDYTDRLHIWDRQIEEFESRLPPNRGIILQDERGGIKLVTRDPSGPPGQWRISHMIDQDAGLVPTSHEVHRNRLEALRQAIRQSPTSRIVDRLPKSVLTEQEIKGYVHMDEVGNQPLFWYRLIGDRSYAERQTFGGFTHGLVIDSLTPERNVAWTRELDAAEQKSWGLEPLTPAEQGPSIPQQPVSETIITALSPEKRVSGADEQKGSEMAAEGRGETPLRKPAVVRREVERAQAELDRVEGIRKTQSKKGLKPTKGVLKKIEDLTSELSVLQGELSRSEQKYGKPKARGISVGERFRRETEFGGPDILSWINENGKMLSRTQARKLRGEDWWKENKSQWDDAPTDLQPHHNWAIYAKDNPNASTPNQVAQAAYDAGVIPDAKESVLWAEIDAARKKRSGKEYTEREQAAISAGEDFALNVSAPEEGKPSPKKPVSADMLKKGETMEVDGEPFEVIKVDADGQVTLKDGRRFGRQTLNSGDTIWVENYQPVEEKGAEGEWPEPEAPQKAQTPTSEATKPSFWEDMDKRERAEAERALKMFNESPYVPAIRLDNGDVIRSNGPNEGHGELAALYPEQRKTSGFVKKATGEFMTSLEVARDRMAEEAPKATTLEPAAAPPVEAPNPPAPAPVPVAAAPAPAPPKPAAPPAGTVDLFGNPVEPAKSTAAPLELPTGKVEPRPLTPAEVKEFDALTWKLRNNREQAGEPLTTEETKRYEYLTALAGQMDLLGESKTTASKGRMNRLRADAAELMRQYRNELKRASESRHRKAEYLQNARTYQQKAIEAEKEWHALNDALPDAEKEFVNPNPKDKPLWEGRTKTGQPIRIWKQTSPDGEYEVEFAGDPRERHWDTFLDDALGRPVKDVLSGQGELPKAEAPKPPEEKPPTPPAAAPPSEAYVGPGDLIQLKFQTGQKVMAGNGPFAREGEIVGPGPTRTGEEQTYFVKTNLGETLYKESDLQAAAPEAAKPEPPKPPEPPKAAPPAVKPAKGLTEAESQRLAELTDKIERGEKLTKAEEKRYRALLEKVQGHEPEEKPEVKAGEEPPPRQASFSPIEQGTAVTVSGKSAILTPPGSTEPRQLLPAYHGTPHEVDKFSTSKIGTGEGKQVYGWGLYFAQKREVAEAYAEKLGLESSYDGKHYKPGSPDTLSGRIGNFLNTIANNGFSEEMRRAYIEWSRKNENTPLGKEWLDWLTRYDDSRRGGANLYTVDIADDSVLLDWDKPISKQPHIAKAVQEFEDSIVNSTGEEPSNITGQTLYYALTNEIGKSIRDTRTGGRLGAAGASKLLNAIGIHGIRYLDQGSRGLGGGAYRAGSSVDGTGQWPVLHNDGARNISQTVAHFGTKAEAEAHARRLQAESETHNYVIWDESKIRITEKNGKPVSLDEFRRAKFTPTTKPVLLGKNIVLNTPQEISRAINDPNLPIINDHRMVLGFLVKTGLLDKLPGLRMEITDFIRGGAVGEYEPQNNLMRFLRWASADTPIHEFFHHLQRFLSPEDNRFIGQLRLEFLKRQSPEIFEQLKGGLESDAYFKADLPRDLYHLANDHEFFAWMMTEKAMKLINKPEARTFIAKVREYIRQIWTAFKDAVGIGDKRYEDVLFREIMSGKYEFVPEEGVRFENRMRRLNLPLDPKEYERKKLYGELGTQSGTVGAYKSIADAQSRIAEELGIGNRARALAGLNRNSQMSELALGEEGGKTNYIEARDTAGTDGERSEVIRDAYSKVIRNQWDTIRLRKRLEKMTAEIESPVFRNRIVKASEQREKANMLAEARHTFVTQIATAAGRIKQQLQKLVGTGAAYDQLQSDLERLNKLPDFSHAVSQRVDDIVNVLGQTDRGISLLLGGGTPSGADIAAEYWAAFPESARPQAGSDMAAYIQLASSVLSANRDLRNQLTSLAMIQHGIITATEINAAGFKIAEDLTKHPDKAVQRLARKAANLGEREGKAEAAWKALNRGVQNKLNQWNALNDAVRLQDALSADPQWRDYVNTVMRDAGGEMIPDDVLLRWQEEHEANPKSVPPPMQRVFFNFSGHQSIYTPTGKSFDVDFGWTPDTVQASQVELGKAIQEIHSWLDNPDNQNHPSRGFWENRARMIEGVLMSSAVWNPNAIRFAVGKGAWGMPEVFYQGLAMPMAKVAFIAQKNFDRLFTQGKGWYMATYDLMRSALRKARKSHDYDELDAQDYRVAVLNNLAWEYRNGREIHVGDILYGHKITREDIALLYREGQSFAHLYNLMEQSRRISGAEDVMETPRVLDEFMGGAWGVRKAMEIGIRKGTTLPRRFSQHGAALASAVHSILEKRASDLKKLPELAGSVTEEQLQVERDRINDEFYSRMDNLLNDPAKMQNFVYAFLGQRNSQIYKTASPYEEQYKAIIDLDKVGDPALPQTMDEIVDFIAARVDAEEAPKVKQQFYGEIAGLTERFYKLTAPQQTEATPSAGQSSSRETPFTHAMTGDIGPAFFYDYGAITAGEARGLATDMALFAWRGVEKAMLALHADMSRSIEKIKGAYQPWRKEQIRASMADLKKGDDFRNLQELEDRQRELERFLHGLGVWADVRAVGAEGINLKISARLMSDAIGAALTGPRTLLRISGATLGGSTVKMGNVLLQLGFGRFRSFPAAGISAAVSMMRFGTAFAFGWYAPGEGFKLGVPAQFVANVPKAVRAFRRAKGSERIYQAIEAQFSDLVDQQYSALRWWYDQKAIGMTPDNPLGERIANILAEPMTKGGVFNVQRQETALGRAAQKAMEHLFYRPLSIGEAGLALIATRFPTGGYNVTYDTVGRMAAWYMDMLATNARRTFDTYEKLHKLGRFNFQNIHDPNNVLAPWEVLPTFWSRIGVDPKHVPSWARPNSTNLQLARELFSSSTDIDLQDLMLRYWARLAQTAPEQRHNVRFLAPEEVDPTRADERAAARARGIISRFVEQTHHAAPSNRPYQLQKAYAFQAFLPFAGWTAQTMKQIPVYLGKAVFSAKDPQGQPFDSHAGMMAAALITALAVGAFAFIGGDSEIRALRAWDRFVNHKNTTIKTIDEAQGALESTEIATHNLTAWIPIINSTLNSLIGSTAYRGQYGFQAFMLDKINAMLNYARGVIRTHDLTYGIDRLAAAQVPFTEPLIENLFSRQGYQNMRNAVRALQKMGPEDLVARRASSSISLPTELTPARLELSEAVFSGDQKLVQEKFQAFIDKATEIGRPEPQRLAAQTFSTLNPYRAAFGTLLTDAQREETLAKMGPWERQAVDKAEKFYGQAATTLGLSSALSKEESGASRQGGGGGVGPSGGITPSLGGGLGGGVSLSTGLGGYGRAPGISRRRIAGGLGPFPSRARGLSRRRTSVRRVPRLTLGRSRRTLTRRLRSATIRPLRLTRRSMTASQRLRLSRRYV